MIIENRPEFDVFVDLQAEEYAEKMMSRNNELHIKSQITFLVVDLVCFIFGIVQLTINAVQRYTPGVVIFGLISIAIGIVFGYMLYELYEYVKDYSWDEASYKYQYIDDVKDELAYFTNMDVEIPDCTLLKIGVVVNKYYSLVDFEDSLLDKIIIKNLFEIIVTAEHILEALEKYQKDSNLTTAVREIIMNELESLNSNIDAHIVELEGLELSTEQTAFIDNLRLVKSNIDDFNKGLSYKKIGPFILIDFITIIYENYYIKKY